MLIGRWHSPAVNMVDYLMQKYENKITYLGKSSGKYQTKAHKNSLSCMQRAPPLPTIPPSDISAGLVAFCRDLAPGSVTGRRPQGEVVAVGPRLIHHPDDGGLTQQTGTVGTQPGE